MRRLSRALFSGVYLHHTGHIERIDTSERIGCDKDYTTVGIYFFLGISKTDRLEYYNPVSKDKCPGLAARRIPAGSFKCERFVKSSLASRMVGFMRGGRLALESSSRSAVAISTVRVYDFVSVAGLSVYPSLMEPSLTHLAILKLKHKLTLVPILRF